MAPFKAPNLGPLQKPSRWVRKHWLPPLNFITIHYAYFIISCMISALIIWRSSTPSHSVQFIDALFLSTSAMTEAGLNTVNLSSLNTFQQVWLLLQIFFGSAIFVSAVVVHFRKAAFEKKFQHVLAEREKRRRAQRGRSRSRGHKHGWSLSSRTRQDRQDEEILVEQSKERQERSRKEDDIGHISKDTGIKSAAQRGENGERSRDGDLTRSDHDDMNEKELGIDGSDHRAGLHFSDDTIFDRQHSPVSPRKRSHSLFRVQGVGADPSASLEPVSTTRSGTNVNSKQDISSSKPKIYEDLGGYINTLGGWMGRNSQMYGLTEKERERLGGYEYRAVKVLSWLVPTYLLLMQFFGAIGCAAWVASTRPDVTRSNGLNPWWVGAFNAVSAFNNSGMSLLDANMTAFQTGHYILLTMGFLILAGNTCYPIFLRLIIWTMWRLVTRFTDSEPWREHARTLKFLLDHPRRCYTNLFPRRHTYWLLASVIVLNAIDWAGFEILNIGNEHIEILPVGVRVIDGLFQAFAVRSGGFYVVPISQVRISLQVLYVVMMYISVYPVVITMRNSNVYEERSLGIYAEDAEKEEESRSSDRGFLGRITGHLAGHHHQKESNTHFIRHQLRAQLAHDMWTVVIALFLIMIIEGGQFDRDQGNFSVFNFLFEIVSGYGCVGISVGIPWENYSFAGTWHKGSKLILCFVMLRGRHRGLPVAIDKAVLLPGEETAETEEADGRRRLEMERLRTRSRGREVV
ncbi:Low-affinity potassium transport protein [Fulvia fulva]|nr:Low-affinity potassium transport protein [Fulvia fulva]WPV13365.1 Low-affinity potassium transport protein [Fulvia fulva]